MIRLSIALEYECEHEKDAIDMVEAVTRQTVDYTNKRLVLVTSHMSIPPKTDLSDEPQQ
jgi:hypothetical protein